MTVSKKKTVSKTQSDKWTKIIEGADSGNKSAQMRVLAAAGVERSDIARFLSTVHKTEVKYQFVRNVLERPLKS